MSDCNCNDIIIEIPTENIVIEMTPEGKDGTDGNGIADIVLLSEVGLVKTYRINYTDGSHFDYTVTDGAQGEPGPQGPAGASEWGDIAGDIADQTDLQEALDSKASIIRTSASGSLVHITDAAAMPVDSLTVGIEPVQDLHGQSAPYPAGGGKNKLPLPYRSSSGVINGVTFTVNDDGTVKANGTAGTGNSIFLLTYNISNIYNGYIVNGCPSGGGNSTYKIQLWDETTNSGQDDTGSGFTISKDNGDTVRFVIVISAGYTANNITFKPMIRLASVTDATYAPYSNICPISGHSTATVTRTGKNLVTSILLHTLGLNNGVVSYNASGTGVILAINTKKGASYKISGVSINRYVIGYYDSLPENGGQTTKYQQFTGDSFTADYDGLALVYVYNGTTSTDTAQIEAGTVATPYEAPKPIQQVTIDLNGTRYGGTVDALTGVMTVTKVVWTKNTSTMNNSADYPGWQNSGVRDIVGAGVSSILFGAISNISGVVSNTPKNYFAVNTLASNDIMFMSKAAWGGKTQDEWIADALDVQVVIPLPEPLEIQLTPAELSLLFGTNNVWSSTGSTSIGYKADTKLYIERLTKPTEDDMVANTNIASGKYFMVGMNLYLSTASIASGETIVPGTNCTALSLADALNNLA